MDIDVARVLAARDQARTYRDGGRAMSTADDRLAPGGMEFLLPYIEPGFRVLDVGCGDGYSLLENAARFREGVGIDVLPHHLELARSRKAALGVDNVRFLRCDCRDLPSTFVRESFDVVFSEAGPLVDSSLHLQAALHTLRTDGLVFAVESSRSASTEWREWTEGGLVHRPPSGFVTSEDQVATLMLRNGVDVRVSARLARKRAYADVYEWLLARFAGWGPDTTVDDRFLRHLRDFLDTYALPDGSIEVTAQHWWVGGVKRSGRDFRGAEAPFFQAGGQRSEAGSQASVPPRSTPENAFE
jgi:SAM-dependent methyltransferase